MDSTPPEVTLAPDCLSIMPLGHAAKGFRGVIKYLDASVSPEAHTSPAETERRLAEMGFVEGSTVEIKHEGFWGRDPIAVKVNNTLIALRRGIADAIFVCPLTDSKAAP